MTTMPSPSSAGTYVYCVTSAETFGDGSPPLRAPAIGGRGDLVRTVQLLDLAAVVSDSPTARYDIGREHTMAHQLVLEEVLARSEILPVRFGTVARSDDEVLEKLLRRKSGELHRLLHSIQGRVELGLKVFWNRERLFAEIATEDGQIRALRDAIAGQPPGQQAHHQRIQLGRLTEEAIVRKRDRDAEAIVAELRPLAVEVKLNRVHTDLMFLNAAFLVETTKEPAFDVAVNAVDEAQAGRLMLKYVGPVPPYNFVNVVVNFGEDRSWA